MWFLKKSKEDIRVEFGIFTQEEVSKISSKGKIQQHV